MNVFYLHSYLDMSHVKLILCDTKEIFNNKFIFQ